MERDEFTFPISSPSYSPIGSPPLWQLSPTASPTPSYGQARKGYGGYPISVIDHNGNFSPRSSCCSYLEGSCLSKRSKMEEDDEDVQEEKMDVLWEDLNEEMCMKKHGVRKFGLHSFSKKGNEMVKSTNNNFNYVNNNVNNIRGDVGNVLKSSKKPSMVVLMKVLRKFFALQQLQKSVKKR